MSDTPAAAVHFTTFPRTQPPLYELKGVQKIPQDFGKLFQSHRNKAPMGRPRISFADLMGGGAFVFRRRSGTIPEPPDVHDGR
jgi:hypothetical protein